MSERKLNDVGRLSSLSSLSVNNSQNGGEMEPASHINPAVFALASGPGVEMESEVPPSGASQLTSTFWSESSSTSSSSTSSSVSSAKRKSKPRNKQAALVDRQQKLSIRFLHPNDVLFGKGKGTVSHPGNLKFHAFVAERKEEYMLAGSRPEKTIIIREIFARIKKLDPPGRFLERAPDGKASGWVEADDSKARGKISQALREHRKREKMAPPRKQKANISALTCAFTPAQHSTMKIHMPVVDTKGTHTDVPPNASSMHVEELTPGQLRAEANRVMHNFGLKRNGAQQTSMPFWAEG